MFNLAQLKNKKLSLLLVIISTLFYFLLTYTLHRTDYLKLVLLYSGLFVIFYKLIQLNKEKVQFLTAVAFLFRAVFILAIPNLSQDFYRFIWDGRMILEGLNPYLYTPEFFISNGEFPVAQAQELYVGMRELNGSHFTNYPPISQLCFAIAGLLSGKSIVGATLVLRLIIIAADFGTLYYGKKLLAKLKLPVHQIFWFALNPFIILELTGNLHFEGVMIFFLVWSLYLLHQDKWKLAAVIFGISIATKLVPIMFLPLLFWWFVPKNKNVITSATKQSAKKKTFARLFSTSHERRKTGLMHLICFYLIVGMTILLLFAPFFSIQFLDNYSQTVGLWFGNFEFNASIYYLARAIGYLFRGWNEIAIIGKVLPIITVLCILYLSFYLKNSTIKKLIIGMLFSFTIYLFLSTTVHPWYIATILILSVFTNYKFPLIWSFVVILSYFAYANENNVENLWIVGLEYIIVFSVFIWEVFLKKKKEIAFKSY